jgi:hypothetical protein
MREFTGEQQRWVLPEVIPVEADMTVFQGLCMTFVHRHDTRKAEDTRGREAMIEQLANIRDAFDAAIGALEAADPLVKLYLGYGNPWASGSAPVTQIEALRSEREKAENVRRALEAGAQDMIIRKTRRSGRTELSTYFCREAWDLYVYLAGNTRIGNEKGKGGPFCRFVQRLGKVFDPELQLTPGSIRKAVQRAPGPRGH